MRLDPKDRLLLEQMIADLEDPIAEALEKALEDATPLYAPPRFAQLQSDLQAEYRRNEASRKLAWFRGVAQQVRERLGTAGPSPSLEVALSFRAKTPDGSADELIDEELALLQEFAARQDQEPDA